VWFLTSSSLLVNQVVAKSLEFLTLTPRRAPRLHLVLFVLALLSTKLPLFELSRESSPPRYKMKQYRGSFR